MSSQLKNKLSANAKHFRYLSRAETFNRNRKNVEELDYLKYYSPPQKEAILQSLTAPIPAPLPPIAPHTISYYRRSSQPVYRTKAANTAEMDGHMMYESLWILASIEDKEFQNYQTVVKEFEQDLPTYLGVNSTDIREMAVMAAGNKIIGKEPDIVRIVENDPRQLWVLINHILDKKIPFKAIMKHIQGRHQIVFKTLYELTNNKQDEAISTIANDEAALECIIDTLHAKEEEIRKYAIRILGNIAADQSEHVETLHRHKLVENTFELFLSSNDEIRRSGCWLISNICCDRISATRVIRQQMLMAKLVDLFTYENALEIQKELTYIFANLAHYAEKIDAYTLLAHENVLEICYSHLCKDENDLSQVTLFLLFELLELGENYKDEEDHNFFCVMMWRMNDLRNIISEKSYSEHNEISSISLDIMNFLEENEDN